MKKLQYILGLTLILATIFTSCDKKYVDPAPKTVPVGTVLTIAGVKALYVPGATVRITQDMSVYGVVTADETSGNLYKESYIQDATGALYLRFTSTSSLYIGDSIRVNLKGGKIFKYNQMLQVDSLDADNNIVKIATQKYRTPEIVTMADLNANMEGFQGKLIQLDNVKFVERGLGMTYADSANQISGSRFLEDLIGTQIEVRTSGYANFANDTLPGGNGSFIGICAQYNAALQLLIRNPNELNMNGPTPTTITKNFDDNSLTSGGWTTQYPVANNPWTVASFATNYYANITNTSSNLVGESWLISPAFDLSTSAAPQFNFKTATFTPNTALKVLISTNYDGVSLPASATWIDITSSFAYSAGSWAWVSSGGFNLSAYKQTGVYFAFKFTGTAVSWDSWEIDDIKILK